MNEGQWRGAVDPTWMLEVLRERDAASARKLRLFAVACCRRIWVLISEPRLREVVDIAERYAGRSVTKRDLQRALTAFGKNEAGGTRAAPL